MKPVIKVKRIYETPAKGDGCRVLVDRLWPRGMKKEDAHIDEWAKDLSPSTELRKWYDHTPDLWSEFSRKYKAELNKNEAVPGFVEGHEDKKTITLLYGAKSEEYNHALVLQKYLEGLF